MTKPTAAKAPPTTPKAAPKPAPAKPAPPQQAPPLTSPKQKGAPANKPPAAPIQAVMMGVEPAAQPARVLKRPIKERYQAEFYMRSTPNVLFELISTPSGFSEWFCDDVNVRGDEFAFEWGGEVQKALCIGRRAGELMRFRWLEDEDPGAYFELRIRIDPMTNDVALVVTDHAWPQDLERARQLWASQVAHLMRVIGS
ncbi:MAG: hypothetical protein IPJ87_04520 [Flavobacteriales bacterium]|nr:hypothetical protein [Flavobacteriales bacterium]MBK7941129.1 hypothetical protein [Flavobacteriales bacterium]MBK8948792.1 hypothetical protein [Flavobacteriales bacterium]MBK9701154.1 hypothetical protein [Flavobacteriales bacterium]